MNNLGILFVVATPIGNLDDITLRAIKTLNLVDVIICEDTRVSMKLLNHLGIRKQLYSYNNYNENEKTQNIMNLLKEGKKIALISDAGMPLISDPGFLLVRECYKNSVKVEVNSGVCSIINALVLSSLPIDSFSFIGFIDRGEQKQKVIFETYSKLDTAIVFFESPRRIKSTLKNIKDFFGEKQEVVIARELTKLYEEIKIDKVENLINFYENNQARGEMVVLFKPQVEQIKITEDSLLAIIKTEMKTKKKTVLAKELSKKYKIDKNEIYQLIVEQEE